MEIIISPHNFKCPNCQTDFTEEDLQNLCYEPFNGAFFECEGCGVEFEAILLVRLVASGDKEE